MENETLKFWGFILKNYPKHGGKTIFNFNATPIDKTNL